ncbi:hypothetical protein T552_01856 [Pneumocystis carinii B80]|uniref:Sorting nexin MVP1 n=1 Tax=Pneumocystis carinii (strain B80) TaxID=1408658 RepID=A0A0W4ZHX7_PNEC8|nr:hypothetical protein T552_01856 [Pneumocystis carinii B80]KTW27991.1 hypothetical protein T552_01856 [Pneumocystis carinii B80]
MDKLSKKCVLYEMSPLESPESGCFIKVAGTKDSNNEPYLFGRTMFENEIIEDDAPLLLSFLKKCFTGQCEQEYLLDEIDVPFVYQKMFTLLFKNEKGTYCFLRKIVELSGLPDYEIKHIINMMFFGITEDMPICKCRFYSIIALIGIAQNGECASVEELKKYKNNLPIPKLQDIIDKYLISPDDKISDANVSSSDSVMSSKQTIMFESGFERTNDTQKPVSLNSGFIDYNVNENYFESFSSHRIFNIMDLAHFFSSADRITIYIATKKEGSFLFKHDNYVLFSVIRGSRVIRRYSDFLWLQECLIKKYPFRQVPLMPPKCFSVNGHYLSRDSAFLKRRYKGLSRFINAVVRHPIFRDDPLVIAFLTVSTEFSLWRKQTVLSIHDEFQDKIMIEDLGLMFPSNFDEIIMNIKKTIDFQIYNYTKLCLIMDRLLKYQEKSAEDMMLFAFCLNVLADGTKPVLIDGIINDSFSYINKGTFVVSKHFLTAQEFLEEEAKVLSEGILEDLKSQRDNLIAIKNMFDRKDKLDINNIPFLEKRINSNVNKLADLNTRSHLNSLSRDEIEQSIMKDKKLILSQQSRCFSINKCILNELVYFQISQAHIGKLYKDYVQERIKYTELLAENWRSMEIQITSIPFGFV